MRRAKGAVEVSAAPPARPPFVPRDPVVPALVLRRHVRESDAFERPSLEAHDVAITTLGERRERLPLGAGEEVCI
jgi:hypothetical protein